MKTTSAIRTQGHSSLTQFERDRTLKDKTLQRGNQSNIAAEIILGFNK